MVTVSRPYNRVNIWQYCSPTSFWSAYGDSGPVDMVSTFGRVGVSPYAEEEPAYNTLFTCASRAAMSTFSVASMLATWEVSGSCTERGTDGIAAWWSTKSTPSTAPRATA